MTEAIQYDLTKTIGRFLDKHFLIVNIFDFLEENKVNLLHGLPYYYLFSINLQIYPENEIKKAKLKLLSSTHMADFAIEIYKGVHGDTVPAGMLTF